MRSWLDVFQVTSIGHAAILAAVDAVEAHRLSFWVAMLRATARQVGCSAILTEKLQDGQRLNGVETVNPFAEDAAPRLAVLLSE